MPIESPVSLEDLLAAWNRAGADDVAYNAGGEMARRLKALDAYILGISVLSLGVDVRLVLRDLRLILNGGTTDAKR